MKNLCLIAACFLLSVCLGSAVFAHDDTREIPAKVSGDHWSCRELAELATKYGAQSRLPAAELLEKRVLAAQLLAVMDKVLEKCGKEGSKAVPPEDLERIGVLHEALKDELAQYEGYQSRREAIEKMLAKPETPPFEYKVGVNGFLRGEGVGNFRLTDFSYAPGHAEGRFLYRVKPYSYWHPTDYLDIHAEGQGYGFAGNDQEYNKVSLYQGFVEAKLPGSDLLALKSGRQEFSYGSTFILGPDSFFDGLSFDAARLRVRPIEPLAIDFLAGAYATPFSAGVKGHLSGAYATYAFSEGNAVEAYALRDSGSTDHHAGERLNIWGGRFTAKAGPLAIEFEPVCETGRTMNGKTGLNDRIDAFGGHLDLSAEAIVLGRNNKFFASYAYGSGSKSAANGISAAKEFRNPNNDSSLFGDMSVVGDLSGVTVNRPIFSPLTGLSLGMIGIHASGLQIYTLGWGVDITREVNFSATGHYFLANYVANFGGDLFSRRLGLESDFTLTWNMADGLALIAGYDRFFTGGYFRDVAWSRKDIDYGYLMVQFDLSMSKRGLKPAKG